MLRAAFLIASSAVAFADGPTLPGPKAPPDTRAFVVSPAPEAVPAFKHRLFPVEFVRKAGNSVPIYLRFAHERNPDLKKLQTNTAADLLGAPTDKFDVAASRKVIDSCGTLLRQIDHAARKKTTDWSYTIDEDRTDVFQTLLPDIQECRSYHRIVCLKARVEIAEGKFDDAVRSLETAFSMADQFAAGPFLIHNLVGLAGGLSATDRIDDFISKPGSPNLYWALTTLPRPVVGVRRGIDSEFSMVDVGFPEFEGLDRVAGAPEFDARLARVKARFESLAGDFTNVANGEKRDPKEFRITESMYPAAREFLLARKLVTAERLAAMPEAQVVLMGIKAQYAERRDERFKALYLPPREARIQEAKPVTDSAPREIIPFTATLLPLLYGSTHAETRLDRRVAALRLIEALRIHAAANGGKLPASLDAVSAVTIPDDPSTARPFSYKLDGDAAVIESPRSGYYVPELKYTVRIRK